MTVFGSEISIQSSRDPKLYKVTSREGATVGLFLITTEDTWVLATPSSGFDPYWYSPVWCRQIDEAARLAASWYDKMVEGQSFHQISKFISSIEEVWEGNFDYNLYAKP